MTANIMKMSVNVAKEAEAIYAASLKSGLPLKSLTERIGKCRKAIVALGEQIESKEYSTIKHIATLTRFAPVVLAVQVASRSFLEIAEKNIKQQK